MSRLARFTNNATSRLAANLSAAGLTLTVTPGDGAKFPSLTGGQYFMATLVKADGTKEIVKVTARASDTLTIVRAAEAVAGVQTAFAFSAGDKIELRLTAGGLSNELDRLDLAALTRATTKSANYAVVEGDISTLIRVDTSGGNRTITLPQISTLTDAFEIVVTKISADLNLVNVTASGADTINGASTYSLSSAYQSAWVIADRSTNTWTAINSGIGGAVPVVDALVGNGTAGPYALSGDPITKNNTLAFVGSVYQQKSTYTLSAGTITFGGIVAVGVPIEVAWNRPVALGSTSDDLVVTAAAPGGLWTTVRGFISTMLGQLGSSLLGHTPPGSGAIPTTTQAKLREVVSLEDFYLSGSSDWSAASSAACVYCSQTGATLRLARGKEYPGAVIEVHGSMSVEGNGATVDFLGVGSTLISGTGSGTSAAPTPWPGDSGGDPTGLYTVKMWSIAVPVAIGDDSITFSSVTGMNVGDMLFIAGNPTTASSPTNYIPATFEFAQVISIVGNVVTFNGKIRGTYTTAGAAFYSAGVAKNGRISNLRVKSAAPTPYQAVVRSAVNYEIDGLEFAGRDALGAATFVEGFVIRNVRATGCGGNWSFARGTVSALLDGLIFQYRSALSSETSCVFIEESCYDVSMRGVRGFGASFSVRVMDMAGANVKRSITLFDSVFDTSNSPGGATSPFQCGTASGVDIEAYGCTFAGAPVVPNASIYPGVTGSTLAWITSNQTTDKVKFSGCHFKGTTTGSVFKKGSGALGQVLFDAQCTFETISPSVRDYTPMGAWVDMAGNFLGGVTVPSGSFARYRATPWDVTVTARIQLNGLATGGTMFIFPPGLRPQAEKRFICATDTTDRLAIVRVLPDPNGNLIYVGTTASPAGYVDCQFTFPLDS